MSEGNARGEHFSHFPPKDAIDFEWGYLNPPRRIPVLLVWKWLDMAKAL